MAESKMQEQIREAVTGNRGYHFSNTRRIPFKCMNVEIGVQLGLANMECRDGKLGMEGVMEIGPRVTKIMEKIEDAGLPLSIITTADGFDDAYRSAYTLPKTGFDNLAFNILEVYKKPYEDRPVLSKELSLNNYERFLKTYSEPLRDIFKVNDNIYLRDRH